VNDTLSRQINGAISDILLEIQWGLQAMIACGLLLAASPGLAAHKFNSSTAVSISKAEIGKDALNGFHNA
jgi:hypothetical protein